jgi:PAT family beta-lactamase induction signal transducer AmpG
MLSALAAAVGCVAGGWMSDRLGRRRMSGLFIAAMSAPTVVMALSLAANGLSAVDIGSATGAAATNPGGAADRVIPASVLAVFWGAVLVYNLFQGLMYGATTALFMDLTTPRVAGTQFTAYMALSNLAISFSAWWQGIAIERLGFPTTLGLDAVVGVLGIGLLPFLGTGKRAAPPATPAVAAPGGVLAAGVSPGSGS